jgi:hypothetical protein
MIRPHEGQGVHAVKRSKFTEDQIAFALKQADLGISDATFYVWR